MAVAAAMLALVQASCVHHKPLEAPEPPVDVPKSFVEAPEVDPAEQQQGPDRWWEAFGDENLNALVEGALSDNFSLRKFWSRLDAAQAIAKMQGASLWPQLNLEAGVSRTRAAVSTAGVGRTVRTNRRSVTPAASYEVDLWGRLRSLRAAATLDAAATRADLDTGAMSLAATLAEVYFSIVEQRARLELIEQQLKVNTTFLDRVRQRVVLEPDKASALDVYQQEQQVAATEAQLPLVKMRVQVLEHQLAVLLGRPPGSVAAGERSDEHGQRKTVDRGTRKPTRGGTFKQSLDVRSDIPDLPASPAAGVPSDLLKRRPDIRAAELRILAADRRIGAAIADRFPSMKLSAALPFQAEHASAVFDNFVSSIAAGVGLPIIDGGRRAADVDRNRALMAEQLDDYASVLLTAMQEVEDALVQEHRQTEYLKQVDTQVELAVKTHREARTRYLGGVQDFLRVLTALQDLQRLQLLQIGEKKRLLSYRIQLYRALGGSWMSELEVMKPRRGEVE